MRNFVTAALASGALIGGFAFLPTAALAKRCPSGDTPAVIAGHQKCLGRGEYCSHAEARQYRRYGFKCVRVRGTYRVEDD
jgi:hypothetical protein